MTRRTLLLAAAALPCSFASAAPAPELVDAGAWSPESPLRAVEWHPSGALLAACDSDGAITLHRPPDLKPEHRILCHEAEAWCVQWSWCGRYLAAGTSTGQVEVWNAQTLQPLARVPLEGRTVQTIRWHPDRTELAVGSSAGLEIREMPDGRLLQFYEHPRRLGGLDWLTRSGAVAFADTRGEVVLWTPGPTEPEVLREGGGRGFRRAVSAPLTVAGATVAVAAEDGRGVHLLTPDRAAPRALAVRDRVVALDASPCGTWLAVGLEDGPALVMDGAGASSELPYAVSPWLLHCLAWRPDGRMLALCSDEGKLHLLALRPS